MRAERGGGVGFEAGLLHVELDEEPVLRRARESRVEGRARLLVLVVRKHEHAVAASNVELDTVCVCGCVDRVKSVRAVRDPDHAVRRMTTTARSSVSSPPAYRRASSVTACASSSGASVRS